MEDQLVTYPVAKLAKEKGFAVETDKFYGRVFPSLHFDNVLTTEVSLDYADFSCWCPTIYQLNRWLRETHQLHVQVSPKQRHLLEWYVYVINGREVVAELKALFFTEYEQALMRGLELALNLLPD